MAVIIWGWRTLKKVLGTGVFHCPQCGTDTGYRLLAARRWFTLFFIPVIPLKSLGTFVECAQCKNMFVEAALTRPTTRQLEDQLGLANRAAIAHLASLVQPVSEDVVARVVGMLSSAAGVPATYDRQSAYADIQAFGQLEVALQQARPIAGQLTPQGCEAFIRRMLTFAEGRGQAADAVIDAYGTALGMPPAHVAGIRQLVARDPGTSAPGAGR
jgi:zinc-ribbon family